MKENNTPQPEEWRQLYTAADKVRALSPWSFMEENFVFGVEDPTTGEIGYCSVLGGLGEVFAFVVYEGAEGLAGIRRLVNEVEGVPPDMIFEIQHALMASFEDREELRKEDLKTIRELGLKFRGKKHWPMFRHYQPGYLPWFLTGPQVRFLTLCLEQALDVLPRFREDHTLLYEVNADRHLVRICNFVQGKAQWQDVIMPIPPIPPKSLPEIPVDEVGIARIRQQSKGRSGSWEVGYLYAPTPIQESPSDRPFFPRLMIVCEEETGIVLTFHMERDDSTPTAFRDHLLEFFLSHHYLPAHLSVNHPIMAVILSPICRKLGIDFDVPRSLPTVEFAISEMFSL